jgi:uncharacterized protein (TIGR03437 family)
MKIRGAQPTVLVIGILAYRVCLPAEDFSAQVRILNDGVARAAAGSALEELLTQRRQLIGQIIKEDAPSVTAAALDPAVLDRLRTQSRQLLDLVEKSGEWTGSLEVVAEMDFQNHKAWTHRYLRLAGERIELFGGPKTFHMFDSLGGRQVRARGIRSEKLVAVDSLAVAAAAAPLACSTTGAQNIAVLTVTSPSNTAFPKTWTAQAIANMFFGTSGSTLNTYWQETSYGKTSAQGSVFGPFTLANDYSCSDSGSDALRKAAIAAAQGTVDFTQFNRVAVVFPAQSCSFGGLASIGCNYTDLPQTYSFAWFPVLSYEDVGSYVRIVAHEGGHNLGLNHANSDDFGTVPLGAPGNGGLNTEYGDPFSVMGVGEQGSSALSTGQYSAQHKAQILGWLDINSYLQVNSAGTYTAAPLEAATGVRGLRILRDPNTRTWLWLESRQPEGPVDSSLSSLHSNLFSGAMIHYETPDLDPLHTYLLDFQPVSGPNNFDTSAMLPGQTWSDPWSLLRLTVNSAGAGGVSVNVGYDTACASMTVSGAFIPLGGGSGTVQVTAPSSCSWTASTGDSWLQLSGTSGNGNGTVSFSAGANSGTDQRNGVVTIERQNFPIVQEGPDLTGIGASPVIGSGVSGTVTLQFAATNGFTGIDQVNGVIGSSPYGTAICYFTVSPEGYMYLSNDAGTSFLGPVFLSQPGTSVSNSTCTIFANGSSVSGSGDVLTAAVHFLAAASVTGSYDVFGWAHNSGGFGGPYTLGEWVFSAPSPPNNSLTISGAASAASFVAGSLAPESIAAVFGSGLTGTAQSACCLPLPTSLGGTTVSIRDVAGTTRQAPLYYVSPAQVNFEIPAGTTSGKGSLAVQYGSASPTTLPITITNSAPGLFVVNATSGLPAALAQTFAPGGTQSVQDAFETGPSGTLVATPIDVTAGQVYLLMFGTGVRGAKTVTATVGGQSVPVPFAGAQGTEVGEDQINIGPLPASLAGSGSVPIMLTADGVKANTVNITIR